MSDNRDAGVGGMFDGSSSANHDDNAYSDDTYSDDGDPGQDRPPRRRRRGLRIAVVSLVLLSLLVVGGAAGYLAFLNNKVNNNLTFEPLMPDAQAEVTTESGTMLPVPVDRTEESGDALNYLIVGSDSRDLDEERGRSDVIVLAHISDDRSRVDLIHFPRDYFVDIPGSSRPNKINAAYSIGGAPLLVETIQPLIGVPIDSVAIVNFESFKALTDAVGGVDVNVAEASPGFPQGTMAMDGETGLEFVRERYALSQGDISRGQRQQAFIKAVMLETLSSETLTNPGRLSEVVDAATKNLTVDDDLDVAEMRSLAFSMRGVRGDDIEFVTAPWTGIGTDEVAGSIVVPAEQQLNVLTEHLQNDTMENYVDDVSPQRGFSN
ncbi:MAG: LCP family protein [Ornithinimicrobium sp.]